MRSQGRFAGLWLTGWLVVAACGPPALAQEPVASRRARALAFYDEGRYAEAKPLLEELDAAGQLDGPLLYRLAFSQRATGAAESSQTQQRAIERLEQQLPGALDLEIAFYLVNSYQNLGRSADVQKLAAETTARVESGELAAPVAAIEMFRLGKLYADLGRDDEADRWFSRAVAGFGGDAKSLVYVQWASRHLADRAWASGNYAAAAEAYSPLEAASAASVVELDRLAVARGRIGQYAGARQAWLRALQLDPVNGDRARYSGQLAEMAEQLGKLPTTDPAGRSIAELGAPELEKLILDQVAALREARAEAATTPKLKKKQRRALEARILATKSLFAAAALEYAFDGQPIRETAFRDGYATLIFQPGEWELTPPE